MWIFSLLLGTSWRYLSSFAEKVIPLGQKQALVVYTPGSSPDPVGGTAATASLTGTQPAHQDYGPGKLQPESVIFLQHSQRLLAIGCYNSSLLEPSNIHGVMVYSLKI
ncbi:hypothetical protein F2Q69_00028497 [Brassica cretica]|uniref:Uncharacterized protein n=1 Tax=Brassica cretica TaxID=69181 RepID=A0A8S9S734_BRACR|nr:hypothetical protein F2Q69_00028497 [Brassica cretica]